MIEDEDFKDEQLINIKLSRAKYELLKKMIAREEAGTWFTEALKGNWLWVAGAGVLTVWMLYDKIHLVFSGSIK